eukprot:2359824-Pleurochrysis_carterae.AAC.6
MSFCIRVRVHVCVLRVHVARVCVGLRASPVHKHLCACVCVRLRCGQAPRYATAARCRARLTSVTRIT